MVLANLHFARYICNLHHIVIWARNKKAKKKARKKATKQGRKQQSKKESNKARKKERKRKERDKERKKVQKLTLCLAPVNYPIVRFAARELVICDSTTDRTACASLNMRAWNTCSKLFSILSRFILCVQPLCTPVTKLPVSKGIQSDIVCPGRVVFKFNQAPPLVNTI